MRERCRRFNCGCVSALFDSGVTVAVKPPSPAARSFLLLQNTTEGFQVEIECRLLHPAQLLGMFFEMKDKKERITQQA